MWFVFNLEMGSNQIATWMPSYFSSCRTFRPASLILFNVNVNHLLINLRELINIKLFLVAPVQQTWKN